MRLAAPPSGRPLLASYAVARRVRVPGERGRDGDRPGVRSGDGARRVAGAPTIPLPTAALVRISLFWLGLTAIDAVVGALRSSTALNFDGLRRPRHECTSLAAIAASSSVFGSPSSRRSARSATTRSSRWGRRKPFIVVGSLFDVLFLLGIATRELAARSLAFVTLLAFSTNIARGPFQGYVPDLVPDRQVGLASAMVGLMQVLGNVTGFALAAIASQRGERRLAIVAIAVIELVTMLSVVLRVPNGPAGETPRGSLVARDRRAKPGARTSCARRATLAARVAAVHPDGRSRRS